MAKQPAKQNITPYNCIEQVKAQMQKDFMLISSQMQHTDPSKPFSHDLMATQQNACELAAELQHCKQLKYVLGGFAIGRVVMWEAIDGKFNRIENVYLNS